MFAGITMCVVDIYKDLFGIVVLYGGTTMLAGIAMFTRTSARISSATLSCLEAPPCLQVLRC